ncbi:MAG: hypothetical protein ACO1SV_21245 [Fimbriimonas sp.]
MSPEPAWVAALYAAVTERPRPEDVAKTVLQFFPDPPHRKKWQIRAQGHSYMSTEFDAPTPLTQSANVLAYLIGHPILSPEETLGPRMDALLAQTRTLLGAFPEGPLDFRHGRLNGEARKEAGITMSRRRYNKLFRLVDFLEREREGNLRYGELCELLRGAKTGILRHLSREEFAKDPSSALFVAYMASRLGMRSQFKVEPQERAFDDLGDALLKDLAASSATNWYAVAHAFPRADVLKRLDEAQRLSILSLALGQMNLAARHLKRLAAPPNGIDVRHGYVVKRGQDSSSWNAAAGAWNRARDFWLSLTQTLGLSTEAMLPGKVPRLMAADLVAWHRSAGNPPHPDERVASELPLPWEVFLRGVECPAERIRAACAKHGVDPAQTGWTAGRERQAIETWRPTPELVHGVAVADPFAAAVMRRLGWFSGPAMWERENYGKE